MGYILAMRKDAENYLISAEYDLATAEHMLKTGRYIYVVFLCHLTLEKLLKAIAVINRNSPAPKTHNLIYLAKLSTAAFSQDQMEFIAKINNASIVTRYPEDFSKLIEAYPLDVVKLYLEQTKDIFQWLKQDEKLKK
jgi:HEPN domain-containing protein